MPSAAARRWSGGDPRFGHEDRRRCLLRLLIAGVGGDPGLGHADWQLCLRRLPVVGVGGDPSLGHGDRRLGLPRLLGAPYRRGCGAPCKVSGTVNLVNL